MRHRGGHHVAAAVALGHPQPLGGIDMPQFLVVYDLLKSHAGTQTLAAVRVAVGAGIFVITGQAADAR